jgi:hypothetical protein
VKAQGLTLELHLRLQSLKFEEVGRIPSVEVKFVDIGKNTNGVGSLLVDT